MRSSDDPDPFWSFPLYFDATSGSDFSLALCSGIAAPVQNAMMHTITNTIWNKWNEYFYQFFFFLDDRCCVFWWKWTVFHKLNPEKQTQFTLIIVQTGSITTFLFQIMFYCLFPLWITQSFWIDNSICELFYMMIFSWIWGKKNSKFN